MIVFGRVQRVGFRAFARRAAQSLGLRGWVRNRSDGTVELVAAGAVEELDELARRLQAGPPGALVEGVRQELWNLSGDEDGFEVITTR
jgi:acylphosphatase